MTEIDTSDDIPQRIILDDQNNEIRETEEVTPPLSQTITTTVTEIPQGEELVIDGELVIPPTKLRKRYCLESFIFCITILLSIYLFIISTNDNSFQTTTACQSHSYDDFVKKIVIPISGEELLDNESTIQHKAWKRLSLITPLLIEKSIVTLNDTDKIAQRYIIMVIYIGNPRTEASHKKFLEDLCQDAPEFTLDVCQFVPCNDNGDIVALVLRNEWMTERGGRSVSVNEIGELRHLTHIIMTRNAYEGTIPTEIGKLTNLRVLNLRDNFFTGTIPTQIGQLHNLEVLLLDGNLLEGTIPSELVKLNKLKYLGFSQNRLTGSVPTSLNAMKNLSSVALDGNNLTGNIDYMCQNNFTTGSSVLELQIGGGNYEYEVGMGVTIDCGMLNEKVECSCCKCL